MIVARRRPPAVAALLIVLVLVTAACAGLVADEARTSQTIGSAMATPPSGASEVISASVPVEGDQPEEWAPDKPVGPPLPALSSAELIMQAVADAHGRTNDVAAEMSRFVAFPDLPTPDRAELIELRADVRATLDRSSLTVTSEVVFTADGSVEELVAMYQAEMADRGWNASTRSEQLVDGVTAQRLSFQIPESGYLLDDFQLLVQSSSADDAADGDEGERVKVSLRHVEVLPAGDETIQDRFAGWAVGIPLPEGGEITGAGIHTTDVGRNSLYFSLTLAYEASTPATVADQIRAALPNDGFEVRPLPPTGDSTDNWVYLASSFFEDSRVSTHAAPNPAEDRTLVNVDARVEFSPTGG